MKQRTKITKELSANFNKIRELNQGKKFGWAELVNLMQSVGISEDRTRNLSLNGVINKVSRGQYMFPSKPVYIGLLQNAAKKPKKTTKSSLTGEDSIQIAINLLKEYGYRVQKQTLDKEAALKNPTHPVGEFIQWVNL